MNLYEKLTCSIAVISLALILVPPLTSNGFVLSDAVDSTPSLTTEWKSTTAVYSQISCLALAWPLLIDLIADYYSYPYRSQAYISNFFLLLTLVLPNLLGTIFALSTFYEGFDLFIPSITNIRFIIVALTLSFSVHTYGSPVWSSKSTFIFITFISVGLTAGIFNAFKPYDLSTASIPLYYVCFGLPTIYFLFLLVKWIKYTRLPNHTKQQLTNNYCCNIHIMAAISAVLSFWIINITLGARHWGSVGAKYLSFTNYALSFVTMLVLIFSGRVHRQQIILKRVSLLT